jgi:hypothetical protein
LADYTTNAYDPNFIPEAGSAANGSVLYVPMAMYDGEDAGAFPTVALLDRWYNAVDPGAKPDEYGVWGWMSGMLFIDGLNAGGGLTRANLLSGLRKITSFTAGGIESGDNPAAKEPPGCYVVMDVVNEQYVRDPSNPTGFNCAYGPNWYRG